jgi:hypothetical protein
MAMKAIASSLILAVILASGPSHASECMFPEYGTSRERIHNTPVIIEAVALGPVEERLNLLAWAERNNDWQLPPWRDLTHFRVARIFKGDVPNPVIVNHQNDSIITGICSGYVGFERGSTYLIGGFMNQRGELEIRDEFQFDLFEYPDAYYEGLGSDRGVLDQMVDDGILRIRRPD